MHGHQIYSVFYTIQSLLVLLFLKKVLFKEDNSKFSGKVSVKKWAIAAIDSLPGFLLPFHYFFDRNKKSKPIPNQEKVRISFVSWRLRDSIADFALGAKSYGDSQFLNWLLRYATGISHWSGFESLDFREIKKPPEWVAFFIWWRLRDSNLWPHACEACALTSWAKPP